MDCLRREVSDPAPIQTKISGNRALTWLGVTTQHRDTQKCNRLQKPLDESRLQGPRCCLMAASWSVVVPEELGSPPRTAASTPTFTCRVRPGRTVAPALVRE